MGHPNRAPFDAAVWLLVALAISGLRRSYEGAGPRRCLHRDGVVPDYSRPCPCVELHGRAPRTALILGLTYPAAFTALFMAVIIASA